VRTVDDIATLPWVTNRLGIMRPRGADRPTGCRHPGGRSSVRCDAARERPSVASRARPRPRAQLMRDLFDEAGRLVEEARTL
jgi:hypothetical protein